MLFPALETSHDNDEGSKPKHVIDDSTTDTPKTLVRAETKTTLDVSLPALEESDDDDAGETGHAIAESTTDKPTTFDPRDETTATLDISLQWKHPRMTMKSASPSMLSWS